VPTNSYLLLSTPQPGPKIPPTFLLGSTRPWRNTTPSHLFLLARLLIKSEISHPDGGKSAQRTSPTLPPNPHPRSKIILYLFILGALWLQDNPSVTLSLMKYHPASILRLGPARHTNCMSWGVTSALGVTLPPPSQGFILRPKFINPDCYSLLVKNQKT